MGGIVLPGLCEAESEPVTAIRYLKSRLRVLVSLHFVRLVGVRSVVAARDSQIISRQIDQLRSGELIPASPQRADRGPHYSQATPARVRDPGSVLRAFTEEPAKGRSRPSLFASTPMRVRDPGSVLRAFTQERRRDECDQWDHRSEHRHILFVQMKDLRNHLHLLIRLPSRNPVKKLRHPILPPAIDIRRSH
jgi:hypothetical protein